MPDIAIRAENLSKRYRIGSTQEPYKTLRESVMQAFAQPARRFAAWFKTSQTEDRKEDSQWIWALRDLSFEVQQGEVIGIIGRNGAGKSTLLKILSSITKPTEGIVEVYGRVGSLLEVGTGFHPELTGRENIYLNGAILGMKKSEIERNFDAIVAFAEIERFLDTPVKRYSSGMYVRLAFAVAAHLQPEILLVDEVLAVGDAAFQRKCIGKMGDVARTGRTVLFVSHNMAAVRMLCRTAIHLDEGRLVHSGEAEKVVMSYEASIARQPPEMNWTPEAAPGNEKVRLLSARVLNEQQTLCTLFGRSDTIYVELLFEVRVDRLRLNPHIHVFNTLGELLFISTNLHDIMFGQWQYPQGRYKAVCRIPERLLNVGVHYLSLYLISNLNYWDVHVEHAVSFEVVEDGTDRGDYVGGWHGIIRPVLPWSINRQENT